MATRQAIHKSKRVRAKKRTLNHCAYCGFRDSATTVDHMRAWINCPSGSKNKSTNLIGCCHVCNYSKGHMSIKDFRNLLMDPSRWSANWNISTQYRLAARYGSNFNGEFFYKSPKLAELRAYHNLYQAAKNELKRRVTQYTNSFSRCNSSPTLVYST